MTDFAQLTPGLCQELVVTVEPAHTTTHAGPPILTTPEMIRLMEKLSAQVVQPLLPAGYTTVGFEVHVRHRAPAPLGSTIRVWASLKEAEGRKLQFEVRVTQDEKLIGEGTHRRTIIPTSS